MHIVYVHTGIRNVTICVKISLKPQFTSKRNANINKPNGKNYFE